MAYWVCHCLFQRLFLCAGRHQVLTVHWRLSQFQSPVRLSSSEFLHFSSRLSPFGPKPHLPRFLPSSRHRRRHPLCNRHPTDCFRPQAFSASRRFSPPSVPRAYSIPQPRPGFSVQGLLSPRSHPPLSGGNSPLSLERETAASSRWRHSQRPRLRGLTPRGDAFLRNGV